MPNFRRLAATVLASATIASGVGAVAAPQAQAKIRSGDYTYTVWGDGGKKILTQPALVRGNRMYLVHEETWYDIVPTKRGGVVTAEMVDRREFWRDGKGYAGVSYMWFIPRDPYLTVRITLTPR